MSSVTVITPTGGRPDALGLLTKMITRQTYQDDLQWIVVDDCIPRTTNNLPSWVDVLHPIPFWLEGQNTHGRNLISGLAEARGDYILIMEDDDWYSREYISTRVALLRQYALVGEGHARYYHVGSRFWYQHTNTKHASLCQTAFRSELIKPFLALFQHKHPIDLALWGQTSIDNVILPTSYVVGIKGLPGRSGIGAGHDPKMYFNFDGDLQKLTEWLDDDACWYAPFYTGDVKDAK